MHPKEQEKQEPKMRVLLGEQCQLPSFFKLEVLTAGLGCSGGEFPSPAGVWPCGVLPEGSQGQAGEVGGGGWISRWYWFWERQLLWPSPASYQVPGSRRRKVEGAKG